MKHTLVTGFKLLVVVLFILFIGRPVLASDSIPPGAEPVYTGVYLMNLYDLDINAYSFYADFYLWFKWKGERDPTGIEFVNAVEKWGFTELPFYEEPQLTEDGWWYNGTRIEGRFYHSFVLNRFPLDRHGLDIRIENVDYPRDSLVYLPDTSSSLFRSDFQLPGWRIHNAAMTTHTNFYETNFGETGTGSAFSNFTLTLEIARPLSYFLLKLMLPLLVVIAAALGALLIDPLYLDARISLPIGGLLSAVFLQQSYSSALPDVGYMVLMDRIYLLSYVLIALLMLRVILAGNTLARDPEWRRRQIRRNDRRLFGLLCLAYLAGIGLLVLLA